MEPYPLKEDFPCLVLFFLIVLSTLRGFSGGKRAGVVTLGRRCSMDLGEVFREVVSSCLWVDVLEWEELVAQKENSSLRAR